MLRLTDRELAVAVALVEAPGHALLERADAREQLAALRAAGVVGADGTPDPEAAATVRVIARSLVRVDLRRSLDGASATELRAWADESDAVTGVVSPDGRVELRRAPREALPQALVRAAGLADGPGPVDDGRTPLAIGADALLAAREQPPALALDTLRAAGVASRQAGEALALAQQIRRAFVAQGTWREEDGELHAGTVAALDAGQAGWWSFAPGEDARPLEPTDAQALSARLVGLLPP